MSAKIFEVAEQHIIALLDAAYKAGGMAIRPMAEQFISNLVLKAECDINQKLDVKGDSSSQSAQS